jgi:PAS domain-containing protein
MPGASILTGSHDYRLVALFIVLSTLAIATALLYRIRAMRRVMANLVHDSEVRLRMLAEAIPQIVWTAGCDGSLDYCNRRWYELTGFTEE